MEKTFRLGDIVLTEKEAAFGRNVVSDMTQLDAYKLAYNTNSTNDKALRVNASRVFNRPQVQAYIRELVEGNKDSSRKRVLRDRQHKIDLIWNQIEKCVKSNDNPSIARYLEILNKMSGEYVNITKDITEKENQLSEMSVDELRQLINTDKE